ncbi:peptidoglycan endopeptidase [Brevibacillus nitrificans]|uniref:Peptidoglycan endopeptidase n=1 Tax=Brevibacillus nitrificans TaxID=651560 RepID=A0A3M8CQ91_9BACL|nr:NlpC/P60 family protein [Brevibacillus nitrificans]RNB77813.1 peptidoglycan endopeptidase [Brevibacillus nitrificans]
MKSALVAVSVATVWTKPESPRDIDRAALAAPVDPRGWLTSLTIEDKLGFYDDNMIQTQALYGTRVEVEEEVGDWSKVLIPDQFSKKSTIGYPGWIPTNQLAPWSEAFDGKDGQKLALVTSSMAQLYTKDKQEAVELAYLTRLPLLSETEGGVIVATPTGEGFLRAEDVKIVRANENIEVAGNRGEAIVENGKRFLGLPYLWGGMSSYGYDCSGFAYNMHRSMGIQIPRDASDQATQGKLVEKEDLLPGDLLFFAFEEGKGRVHHVGIYMGNQEMIHSPDTRGAIEIVKLDDTYRLIKEHCVSRRYW